MTKQKGILSLAFMPDAHFMGKKWPFSNKSTLDSAFFLATRWDEATLAYFWYLSAHASIIEPYPLSLTHILERESAYVAFLANTKVKTLLESYQNLSKA